MARSCVFCGTRPVTREHVVSEWVSEALNGLRPGTPEPFIWKDETGRYRGSHRKRIDVVAKVVCAGCNRGWMGDIERKASQILKPMIAGRGVVLWETERANIAAWAALKAILHRYVTPGLNSPEHSWLRHLFQHRLPPPTCFVWVAAYRGKNEFQSHTKQLSYGRAPYKEPRPEWNFSNAINMTMTIGHLLVNVLWVREGNVPKPDRPGFIRVWPDADRNAIWPPLFVYDDHGVTKITERFEAASRHLDTPEEERRAMAEREREIHHKEHAIRGANEIRGIADELWERERQTAIEQGTDEQVLTDIESLLRRMIGDAVAAGWHQGLKTGQDWASQEFGRLVRLHGLPDGLIPPPSDER